MEEKQAAMIRNTALLIRRVGAQKKKTKRVR